MSDYYQQLRILTIVVSALNMISISNGASAQEGISMLVWYSPHDGLFIGKSHDSLPEKFNCYILKV